MRQAMPLCSSHLSSGPDNLSVMAFKRDKSCGNRQPAGGLVLRSGQPCAFDLESSGRECTRLTTSAPYDWTSPGEVFARTAVRGTSPNPQKMRSYKGMISKFIEFCSGWQWATSKFQKTSLPLGTCLWSSPLLPMGEVPVTVDRKSVV